MYKYFIVIFLSSILFGCDSLKKLEDSEAAQEELEETKTVTEMMKSDSLKMDSMRKAMDLE